MAGVYLDWRERSVVDPVWAGMYHDRSPLFSFEEQDHLTRIHLRLGLEDLGFRIEERDASLAVHNTDAVESARPVPAAVRATD